MMEIRRIKVFTLKITWNISMVDVQYTLIVQLWNNGAFHTIIRHILGVQGFSCNHLSHTCLIKKRGLMQHLLNNIQRNSAQNFGPDFNLQKDDLHSTEWPKNFSFCSKSILQHPKCTMSFFGQRRTDLKALYTLIRNYTGFQIRVEPKV